MNLGARFRLVFFLAALWQEGLAQDEIRFNKITIEDGLTSINAITKDRKGFMWFGGTHGLYRFDGYAYRVFNSYTADNQFLSSDNINTIYEDSHGDIWVGTIKGLNKFSVRDERFVSLKFKGNAIDHSTITDIEEDTVGNIWIATLGNGIFILNEATNTIQQFLHIPSISTSLSNNDVFSILKDSSGKIWVTSNGGSLDNYDVATRTFTHYTFSKCSLRAVRKGQRIIEDSFGKLWIGTEGNGLYEFDPVAKSFKHYKASNNKDSLSNSVITDLAQSSDGEIWMTTDGGGGINRFNRQSGKFTIYKHDPYDQFSVSNSSSYCLFIDDHGSVWVGMGDGVVNKTDESPFRLYQQSLDPSKKSLSFRIVVALAEDQNGKLWIGTGGKGLDRFDPKKETFKNFHAKPGIRTSLQSDIILDACPDKQGYIWVGTFMGGLSRLDPKSGHCISFMHDENDPFSLANDHVFDVLADDSNQVWLATQGGGLDCLDIATGKFSHFRHDPLDTLSISSDRVISLFVDFKKQLWIGTIGGGVQRMDKNAGSFQKFDFSKYLKKDFNDFPVHTIYQAKNGKMLVGTGGAGLIAFDDNLQHVDIITVKDGLPSNSIYGINEDCRGNIWLSTNRGIVRYDLNSGNLRIFNVNDGLPSNDFESGTIVRSERCMLYFGSKNGIVSFDPENFTIDSVREKVTFTGLKLANQLVSPGQVVDNITVLTESISVTDKIHLPYALSFSIEFAVVGTKNIGKLKYRYKLKGLDDRWIESDGDLRIATFSNLWEGTYWLEVQAANSDGVWSNHSSSIRIIIDPPLWRSALAYTFYACLLVFVATAVFKTMVYRIRLKNELTIQRYTHEKDKEVYHTKIDFFTTISHELRTPLTLILGPLERLLKQEHLSETQVRQQLSVMQRNGQRLIQLVNQLLDFRKIESGNLKLQVSPGSVAELIEEVMLSFKDFADLRSISLISQHADAHRTVFFDSTKIEIILYNLISNALRHTSPGGMISVQSALIRLHNKYFVKMVIADTGIGMPAEFLDRIFDPFFMIDNSVPGSGLGLWLVKNLITIHHGSIEVNSTVDVGSSFTILFPADADCYGPDELLLYKEHISSDETISVNIVKETSNEINPTKEKPFLLIVEDNSELRQYLIENFTHGYILDHASNGSEAFTRAVEKIPDLIISDVMMPVMNGVDLCRAIKNDERTCHIPVILLTARTAIGHKLEGLESGADDYVTKPFSLDLLNARIWNLINSRKKLQARYARELILKPSNVIVDNPDERFLQRIVKILEDNIVNSEFTVVDLVREAGMSHSVLYRKILALTGKPVNDLIKSIRLKRAEDLLRSGSYNVNEVSDLVGFSNSKYFSTCFKAKYGVSPMEFIKAN